MQMVEVNTLKEWVENWFIMNRHYHPYAKSNNIPIPELYDILERMPTIDAVPVVHGVPNPIEEVYEDTDGAHVYRHIVGYECPFCGSDRIAKYCADCGAKMDGERRDG